MGKEIQKRILEKREGWIERHECFHDIGKNCKGKVEFWISLRAPKLFTPICQTHALEILNNLEEYRTKIQGSIKKSDHHFRERFELKIMTEEMRCFLQWLQSRVYKLGKLFKNYKKRRDD